MGELTTSEVPGLAEALNRPAAVVVLHATLRNGERVETVVRIPDERSALVLKTLSWDARRADRDAVDVWRCLEIAHAAGLKPAAFQSHDGSTAVKILDRAFGSARAEGLLAVGDCAWTQSGCIDEVGNPSARSHRECSRLKKPPRR